MSSIDVQAARGAYQVRIETGLLDQAGEVLAPHARGGRLPVVSDRNVWAAQGHRLGAALASGGIQAAPILIEPGEGSKDWATLATLIDRLLELEVGRGDHIIAFGGGVIGDIAGFAAAILKRGCGLVHVPTSLLAQVDSAVGGKSGINVPAGKNLVGAFYPPDRVLIDPKLLASLPDRHMRAGYAEVVKYGLIGDADFFAWCEAHHADLLARDPGALQHAIHLCLATKARIVAGDELDRGGDRALLNFGHTFGHALEAEAGFCNTLLHGEAVAIGMALAFRFSAARGLCSKADADRVVAHLDAAGLPTRFDGDPHAIAARMRSDKKAQGGRLPLILTRGIGAAFVDRNVALAAVEAFLAMARQ